MSVICEIKKMNKTKRHVLIVAVVFVLAFFWFFASGCASTKINSKKDYDSYNLYEYPFESETLKDRFIFIRLYNPQYKNELSPSAWLQKGCEIIETNEIYASHSAIGFSLDDEFYGLTAYGEKKFKLEQCTDTSTNPYMNSCDPNKSMQTTFVIKVSKKEFEEARELTEKFLNNDISNYDVLQNFKIARKGLSKKFLIPKRIQKQINYSEDFKAIEVITAENASIKEDKKNSFVCSSLITYILINSVKEVRNFVLYNYLDYKYFTPTDLANFPGMKMLFTSSWADYNVAANKYLEKYPDFKIGLSLQKKENLALSEN